MAKYPGGHGVAGTVAHELGHSCGVWHHADPNEDGKETTIYPSGVLNTLAFWRTKSSQSEVCGKTLPAEFWIGHKHNRMSGNAQCVMKYLHRYDAVYPSGGGYDCVDLTANPENRELFCNDSTGTGCNAGDHCAGNALRGNCSMQLFVNDKYD
jgi:hypothetical protein